jgi:hypothetical protein
MDVKGDGRSAPAGGERVVSRPHLPAYLWYGFWAVLLGAIIVGVLRMTAWDGTLMMFVPISLLVAFGAPLFLVLRNLTAVAIVETGAVELRRFFMPAWRLQRRDIFYADPTPGIIEGRLRLHASNSTIRVVPGFLVRGMRSTWVEDLRNAPSSGGFAGMSREDRDQFLKAARRSSVEGDETLGTSPEQRWRNWLRWDMTQRIVTSISFGLALISLFLPLYREVWLLDVLIASAAVGIAIKARLRHRGQRPSGRETGLVIGSLLPGLVFTRGQFDWQILDPGIGTIALYFAGVIWIASLIPPWRGIVWAERARYFFLSAIAFGATAFWADRMLAFANMRFDGTKMPSIEVASVLRVEESTASRYTPATVIVDLGSSRTFGFGVTARFVHYAMPAGHLAVGGQCVLMVRPGLLHVRWLQVAICR